MINQSADYMKGLAMKQLNIKAITLALSLTIFSAIQAQATTLLLSADTNPSTNAEQYQFTNSAIDGATFSDILNLSVIPFRDLFASISGTSADSISFSVFDLYSGFSDGLNVLVETGDVISPLTQLSFGSLTGSDLGGNYFIKIEGTQFGNGSYNGNISLTSAVPEPETYTMLLAGLGLLGFISRRRNLG